MDQGENMTSPKVSIVRFLPLDGESVWIGTANHGFAVYAQEELKRRFPGTRFTQLVAGEVFSAVIPAARQEAAAAWGKEQPVFLRHIQPVSAEADFSGDEADLWRLPKAVSAMLKQVWPVLAGGSGTRRQGEEAEIPTGACAAVQIRRQDFTPMAYTLKQLKEAIASELQTAFGWETIVKEADWVISVFLGDRDGKAFLGVSRPAENLSDWSGGAIRFRREEGQISRAKFKLLEAEQVFSLDFSRYSRALDIGAAPGGWTSLLLERGLEVTAVDPARLDPSLKGHPRLTFLRKNAAEVHFSEGQFDLLVCDMSWSPRQMVKLVSGLAYALCRGGTAVITLKFMHKKPFQAFRETVEALKPSLSLIGAKQLFHNREELTLCLMKR